LISGRIAAAHGWFNRICQVAPICTPIGIHTEPVLSPASRFDEYIDHRLVQESAYHLGFKNQMFVRRLVKEGQNASSSRISWRSVEPLLSYDDLTVFHRAMHYGA